MKPAWRRKFPRSPALVWWRSPAASARQCAWSSTPRLSPRLGWPAKIFAPPLPAPTSTRQRVASTVLRARWRSRPTTRCSRRRSIGRWLSPIKTARPFVWATSQPSSKALKTPGLARGRTKSRPSWWTSSASLAQTSSRPQTASARCCRSWPKAYRNPLRSRSCLTVLPTFAPRFPTPSSSWCWRLRWWWWSSICSCATSRQPLSPASPCRCRWSAPSRWWCSSIFPSTTWRWWRWPSPPASWSMTPSWWSRTFRVTSKKAKNRWPPRWKARVRLVLPLSRWPSRWLQCWFRCCLWVISWAACSANSPSPWRWQYWSRRWCH